MYDPYLRGIYDADGERNENTTNDNGGRSRNSRVYFTPNEDATYYVGAAGADRDPTGGYGPYIIGTYTLSVTDVTDDYAADTDTTGTVTVGGSATGAIGTRGDEDWFAVELAAGTEYRIDLESSSGPGGRLRDPYLRGIHDASGDEIANTSDDNGSLWLNSRVFFTPAEDATYYVAAGADGNNVGVYTLSVTDVTDDYAAGTDTTGTVTVGGSATGAIGTRGDEDWFAVELEAGTEYRIDLERSSGSGGRLENPYLRGIYDADGEPIADTSDDNDGWGLNSRVHFTPDATATYYVAAAAAVVNHVGVYTLSVEEVDGM